MLCDQYGEIIARVSQDEFTLQNPADLALIAQAPEILNQLKRLTAAVKQMRMLTVQDIAQDADRLIVKIESSQVVAQKVAQKPQHMIIAFVIQVISSTIALAASCRLTSFNNMKNFSRYSLLIASFLVVFLTGCARVGTGEVGLRVGFDKQVEQEERMPGSFNNILWGELLTFKVQDVAVLVDNMNPLASDNSTIKDFDMTVVYNINPSAVSDLWTTKNKSFHAVADKGGDILLMQNYIALSARNAAYKVARGYESLKMNDSRQAMEISIREAMVKTLTEEKLADKITISQVQVRQILPADAIVQSANELVRAQNELKTKEVEVQTAKKEAERIAALNSNAGAIGYMNAMANMKIAEGVAAGKVQTIVVPYDFKGIVNAK